MIQDSVNDLKQRTVRQFRELLPQVVSKLEGALAPRDAQIVALGQACHSLVGNQNFLLQQTMHMVNPVQPGKDTDKVILGPDGSRSRADQSGRGGALQQRSVAPPTLDVPPLQGMEVSDGFSLHYPSKLQPTKSEIIGKKGAYAQEKSIDCSGRDSALSLDNGSIGSFDSQAAASRPARGVNRPSGRIVAPEAVPPHPRGALAVRLPRRHRSETPEQGRRSATPPLRRRQRSHTPLPSWNPPPVSR
jgi:hypothetical protein